VAADAVLTEAEACQTSSVRPRDRESAGCGWTAEKTVDSRETNKLDGTFFEVSRSSQWTGCFNCTIYQVLWMNVSNIFNSFSPLAQLPFQLDLQ
jgi:hypothetical protein